jgi:hypothetical protein
MVACATTLDWYVSSGQKLFLGSLEKEGYRLWPCEVLLGGVYGKSLLIFNVPRSAK